MRCPSIIMDYGIGGKTIEEEKFKEIVELLYFEVENKP
jgi:hypothetical protein